MQNLLIDKAVSLRDTTQKLKDLAQLYAHRISMSDPKVMLPLHDACATCVEMGAIYLDACHDQAGKQTHQIFDTLVGLEVIDRSLSRRLLSLISFGKLVQHAQRIKGKKCNVHLQEKHLDDMQTFTENLLMAQPV